MTKFKTLPSPTDTAAASSGGAIDSKEEDTRAVRQRLRTEDGVGGERKKEKGSGEAVVY